MPSEAQSHRPRIQVFHINVFKISTDSLCIFTKSYNYSFKAKQYAENRTVASFRKYTVFTSYTRTEAEKFHIESICKSLNISIDRKFSINASYNISLWIFEEQDIYQKSKNGYRFGIADKIASVSGLPEAIIFSRKRFARLYSLGSPSSIITLMDL